MREGRDLPLDVLIDVTSGFQEVPGEEVRAGSGREKENGEWPGRSRNEAATGEGGGGGESPRAETLRQVEAATGAEACQRVRGHGWEPRGSGVLEAR